MKKGDRDAIVKVLVELLRPILQRLNALEKAVGDTWQPNSDYKEGDRVIHRGVSYVAKTWHHGFEPGNENAWEVHRKG